MNLGKALRFSAILPPRFRVLRVLGNRRNEETLLLAIAREVLELLGPRCREDSIAGTGPIVQVLRGDESAEVVAIPGEIREMLLNLCVNACDSMSDAGELVAEVSIDEPEGVAILRIIDSGSGIPEHAKARLFEPFFTTKGKDGTGLGLAIVRRIVLKLGGAIEVESADSGGTCFCVRLPLAPSRRLGGGGGDVPQPRQQARLLAAKKGAQGTPDSRRS